MILQAKAHQDFVAVKNIEQYTEGQMQEAWLKSVHIMVNAKKCFLSDCLKSLPNCSLL